MRKKIFAGNWKMHIGPKEAEAFILEFAQLAQPDPQRDWVIFPPYVTLQFMQRALSKSFIKYGAQNCYFEPKGAFTGEISPPLLRELGCHFCLVGHSERRQFFGETDSSCAKKIKALSDIGITPMLCVGETQKQRDDGQTGQILMKQIAEGLSTWDSRQPLAIAYEPVWAIGTGVVATPEQAENAHKVIRQLLAERFGPERAAEIQILYGGSIKPDNCRELIALPNIDGFLVGGASLTAKSFAQIGLVPL